MPASRAANSETFALTTPSDVLIRIERLFDAPSHLIFDAMTQPEHVRHWWGCLNDDHGVAECEIDLRVGGAWRFVGYGPEGNFPAFYGTYKEIARPDRLVNTEFFEPFPDAGSMVTTTFTKEGGKTRMVLETEYPSKEVRDQVLATGMEYGAATSYDRLEDRSAQMAHGAATGR